MQVDNLKVIAEKITDASAIKIERVIRQKYIYHYTSREGLRGILESGKLWFSKIDCLNDKNEIFDGINLFIGNLFKGIISEDDTVSINKIKGLVYENLSQNLIFVCSFSKKKDEIALWDYYTKDTKRQGYNIAFEYRNLLSSIVIKNRDILDKCLISFGQVEYFDKNKIKESRNMWEEYVRTYPKEMEEIFLYMGSEVCKQMNIEIVEDEIINSIRKYFNEIIQRKQGKLPSIVAFDGESLKFKRSIQSENVVYCKSETWSYEHETRIIVMVPQNRVELLKDTGIYKVRYKDSFEIPYLELDYDEKCIQGIMTSPHINLDSEKLWIEELCYTNKVNINKMKEGIRASSIPVRY